MYAINCQSNKRLMWQNNPVLDYKPKHKISIHGLQSDIEYLVNK
jgi:hypothetical protein